MNRTLKFVVSIAMATALVSAVPASADVVAKRQATGFPAIEVPLPSGDVSLGASCIFDTDAWSGTAVLWTEVSDSTGGVNWSFAQIDWNGPTYEVAVRAPGLPSPVRYSSQPSSDGSREIYLGVSSAHWIESEGSTLRSFCASDSAWLQNSTFAVNGSPMTPVWQSSDRFEVLFPHDFNGLSVEAAVSAGVFGRYRLDASGYLVARFFPQRYGKITISDPEGAEYSARQGDIRVAKATRGTWTFTYNRQLQLFQNAPVLWTAQLAFPHCTTPYTDEPIPTGPSEPAPRKTAAACFYSV